MCFYVNTFNLKLFILTVLLITISVYQQLFRKKAIFTNKIDIIVMYKPINAV
jgi:hypothetical protein